MADESIRVVNPDHVNKVKQVTKEVVESGALEKHGYYVEDDNWNYENGILTKKGEEDQVPEPEPTPEPELAPEDESPKQPHELEEVIPTREDLLAKYGVKTKEDGTILAGEVIKAILACKSVEELTIILGDETRATVKKAAEEKKAEL